MEPTATTEAETDARPPRQKVKVNLDLFSFSL